jgi:ribosomal protein L19
MGIRHKDFVKTKRFKDNLRKRFDFKRLLRKRSPSILEVKSTIKLDSSVLHSRKFKTGDVLDLTYLDLGGRKIRKFTGLCISIVNRGANLRYSLRNVFSNIPIELAFDGFSPSIISLGKAQIFKSVSNSRSKLYYLRVRRITDSKV